MSRFFFNARNAGRTWFVVVGAVGVYALLTALITLDFLPQLGSTLYNWGDALQQTWTLGWNAQQFLRDPLRLYEATIFYPYPHSLAFSDTLVPQSALALPIILATGNYALAHNLNIFLAFVLNGLGMFLLLRVWRANVWGALIGGAIFAFGHFHLAHFGHLNLLSTEWMPFTILFLDRALCAPRVRYFFLFGLMFFLSATSSFYYAFITAALVLVYASVMLVQARFVWRRAQWLGIFATLGAVLLCLVPFGLPYIELSRAFGLQREYHELLSLSATPASYLASLSQHPPAAWLNRMFPPKHGETILSPGLLAWGLALVALAQFDHWKIKSALLAIALVGFILSLGPEQTFDAQTLTLPYKWLYDMVPGLGGAMRALARWGVLVLFAAAALAGLAFARVTQALTRAHVALAIAATALALGWMYWEYDQSPTRLMTGTLIRRAPPQGYAWLATQPDGAVIELPFGDEGGGIARDVWYQYYALLHPHRIVNGSLAIAPLTYPEIKRRVQEFPSADALDLLRALEVQYVIVHPDAVLNWEVKQTRAQLFADALELVYQDADTWIYRVTPRAPQSNAQARLVLSETLAPDSITTAFIVAEPSSAQHEIFSERGLLDIQTQWFTRDGELAQQESTRVRAPLLRDESGVVAPFELRAPSARGTYRVIVNVNGLAETRVLRKTVQVRETRSVIAAPALQLVDAFVGRRAGRSGEYLDVTLFWKTYARVPRDENVFIHVRDANGNTRAEYNGQPYAGALPLSKWEPGQIVVEKYPVLAPRGLPQDSYTVVVGWTDSKTGEPIPIRAPDYSVDPAIALDFPAYLGRGWSAPPLTPTNPLAFDFGASFRLAGFDLERETIHAGESVPLVLYWVGRERTAQPYNIFVHVVDAQGELVAQRDAPPLQGRYPTFAWNDGEWVRDTFVLELPNDLSPGEYTVIVGMYNPLTGERILTSENQDHARIATLFIQNEN